MGPEMFWGKPYAKCTFLSGARKNSGPLRSGPDTFFQGSLKQNTNFRPAQQNFPVQIYGTGNFFLGKPYAKCKFLSGTRKKIRSAQKWTGHIFLGKPKAKHKFPAGATKLSGPDLWNRKLFLGEALRKMQIFIRRKKKIRSTQKWTGHFFWGKP